MKHTLLFVLLVVVLALTSSASARSLTSSQLTGREVDDENLMATLTYRALDLFSMADEEENEINLVKRQKNRNLQNCSTDRDCPSTRYCSRNSGKCFKLHGKGQSCRHDYVCATGYCGRRTSRCASKKQNGATCFGSDSACSSEYCNSATDKCSKKGKPGSPCFSGRQCSSGYCRKNGTCSIHYHRPRPPPPIQTGK